MGEGERWKECGGGGEMERQRDREREREGGGRRIKSGQSGGVGADKQNGDHREIREPNENLAPPPPHRMK
jgi:hypothetical protein